MFEFPDLYRLHSIYFHVLNRTLSTVLFHGSFSVDKMHAVGLVVNFITRVSAYSWLLVPTERLSTNQTSMDFRQWCSALYFDFRQCAAKHQKAFLKN